MFGLLGVGRIFTNIPSYVEDNLCKNGHNTNFNSARILRFSSKKLDASQIMNQLVNNKVGYHKMYSTRYIWDN